MGPNSLTTDDVSKVLLDSDSELLLPEFVSQAKSNVSLTWLISWAELTKRYDQNVSALLSIGGWTGSRYFSPAVASEANRTLFVQTMLGLVSTYNLDGIDFEYVSIIEVFSICPHNMFFSSWEYPNKQGLSCNMLAADDSKNFLLFLQALRATSVGSNLILSAAVSLAPFNGPDAQPMTNVSEFAEVLDHIGNPNIFLNPRNLTKITTTSAIMAYDVGSVDGVGPNAPLVDSCAPNKLGSATGAVDAWTAAGFPANQVNIHSTPSCSSHDRHATDCPRCCGIRAQLSR